MKNYRIQDICLGAFLLILLAALSSSNRQPFPERVIVTVRTVIHNSKGTITEVGEGTMTVVLSTGEEISFEELPDNDWVVGEQVIIDHSEGSTYTLERIIKDAD